MGDETADLANSILLGQPLTFETFSRNAYNSSLSRYLPQHSSIKSEDLVDALLTAKVAAPGGLFLEGVVIIGDVDLERCSLEFPISITDSHIFGNVRLASGTFSSISFDGTSIYGDVLLQGARASNFTMRRSTIDGQLVVSRTHINGLMNLSSATIRGDTNSIIGDGLVISADCFLDGMIAHSCCRLVGASIGGQLRLSNADLTGEDYALAADGLMVGGDFVATDLRANGEVRLLGAKIAGQMTLSRGVLRGFGINADGIEIDGGLFLRNAWIAGTARFIRAKISGEAQFEGTILDGSQTSLALDGATIDGILDLRDVDALGEVRMITAAVRGQFRAPGARLHGVPVSLNADGLEVGQMILEGVSCQGAVRLLGANIKGQADLEFSVLRGWPVSLICDRATFRNSLLCKQLEAKGTIRLVGSHIEGQLVLGMAKLQSPALSLDLERASVDGVAFLNPAVCAGQVDLSGANISSLTVSKAITDIHLARWQVRTGRPLSECLQMPALRDAAGLNIRDIHGEMRGNSEVMHHWLSGQDSVQPWQAVAAVYDSNGQPDDAKRTRYLSAKRSLARSSGLSRVTRTTYYLTTGLGYYPLRALGWLALILAMTYLMARYATDGALPTTSNAAGSFDAWKYALSISFPAAAANYPWDLAQPWSSVSAVLRLAAWALTALLLAGVTGLLRRST